MKQKRGAGALPIFGIFCPAGAYLAHCLTRRPNTYTHTQVKFVDLFVMAEKNRGLMFPPDDLIFVIFVRFIAPFL